MKQTPKTPKSEIEKAKRLLEDSKKGVIKMSKFKNWKDVKKELNFTPEEIEEMELEKEIIKATIDARKKANMTQQELSEKSGIIQPSIAKIENFVRTPQYTTLMKMLYAMGYTLSVVPLDEKIKKDSKKAEIRQ